ncbi:MAG TPA: cytochrome c oxidase subunit II [Edaphocola sp.]|nr:cytochrome c oxidase subunit II [Edaphocola sp.]
MSLLLLSALLILIFIVIYQITRAVEYVNLIRGDEVEVNKKNNKILAWILFIVFIAGMYGVYETHRLLAPIYLPQAASIQGVQYEKILLATIIVTGTVFFITQTLLFWFSFRYQAIDGKKPLFYAHNNKLEVIWTTVPAITLMILIGFGLKSWVNMTGKPPADAMKVQVVGKQFNFIIRYAGKDGVFGKTNFRNINDANNVLGLDWNDPASKDDIIIENGEVHVIKDIPVQFIINSRDVIHNLFLPHFRMKMDAVPGITTSLWVTPTITTKEMAKITENPDFVYEIPCSELCGSGHYSMRGTVVVETKGEFNRWIAQQKPYYALHKDDIEGKAAPVAPAPTTTDSTASTIAVK